MARVLVIDDEAVLRTSMARGISKLPGLEVLEAGTMAEAAEVLDGPPLDLIVADIDLPDRSGIEILGELGRRGLKAPVVFVSAYLKAYRSQIPPHADVEVHEKPIGLDELREIVKRRIGTEPEPAAMPFSFPDLLQLACIGRHSVMLEVRRAGALVGSVVVTGGEVWTASDANGTGEGAFRRLMFAEGCQLECRTLRQPPGQRTLFQACETLLMESARLEDEARAAAAAPATATPLPAAPSPPPVDDGFDATWEAAVDALLVRDYATAHRALLQAAALRPDDRRVAANLARLAELGFDPNGTTA